MGPKRRWNMMLAISALCALACSSKHSDSGAAGRAHEAAGAGSDNQTHLDAGSEGPSTDASDSNFDNGTGTLTGPKVGASGAGGAVTQMPVDPKPEKCDGEDNDGNGIVDDVDERKDGVCDCLKIATIGQIGPWSDGGNVFKKWLNERTSTPAVELGDMVLTDDLLKQFQVIVVLHVAPIAIMNNGTTTPAHHEFTEAESAAFARWVEKGGGAMTTIGYTTMQSMEVVNVNRLLAPLNVTYSTSKFDLNGYITKWDSHPVTEAVMRVYIEHGVEPEGSAGTVLARDDSGHLALSIATVKDGRLIVWGDEWITYDSQWVSVTDQQVQRLWLNILKWLSPPKACQVPIPSLL